MKAYLLVDLDKKIEPFGEHPRECLVGNRKLYDYQKETLFKLGIDFNVVMDFPSGDFEEECIVFSECLCFTPEFLSQFIVKARLLRGPVVCRLKKGITTLRTAASLQETKDCEDSIEMPLWYFPSKSGKKVEAVVVIDCDQFDCRVPAPHHMCGDHNGYAVPMTDIFAILINHWVNLWVANVLFTLANLARIKKMSKVVLLPWKVFRNLNKVGKNCKIHKSAVVEASIVGRNVTIEAGAVIRASVIGDNAHIGNRVVVEESVIGAGCKILHGHILFSALYPETFSVTGFVSATLTGKNVFIGANVSLTDFRFDRKNVLVESNSCREDSGNLFLGSCLGHGVYLGSGIIIAPGRTVPNGLRLVPIKNKVFTKYNQKEENVRAIDYKA